MLLILDFMSPLHIIQSYVYIFAASDSREASDLGPSFWAYLEF